MLTKCKKDLLSEQGHLLTQEWKEEWDKEAETWRIIWREAGKKVVGVNLKNHDAEKDVDRVPLGNGMMWLKCFGTQFTKRGNGKFLCIWVIFVFIQKNMMTFILLFTWFVSLFSLFNQFFLFCKECLQEWVLFILFLLSYSLTQLTFPFALVTSRSIQWPTKPKDIS